MDPKHPFPATVALGVFFAACAPPGDVQTNSDTSAPLRAGRLSGTGRAEAGLERLASDLADARACQDLGARLGENVSRAARSARAPGRSTESDFPSILAKSVADMNLAGCAIAGRERTKAGASFQVTSHATMDPSQALSSARTAVEAHRAQAAGTDLDQLDHLLQTLLIQGTTP